MEAILAGASVSVTELKRNPSAVIEAADGEAVAVLVHNRPSAYLVPAAAYKRFSGRNAEVPPPLRQAVDRVVAAARHAPRTTRGA